MGTVAVFVGKELGLKEAVGFEPTHEINRLTDFESVLLSQT